MIKLTPEMIEIIHKTLEYHNAFRNLMIELINQGVDRVELDYFDGLKRQIEEILKEYGG